MDQIIRALFSGDYEYFERKYQHDPIYAEALDEVFRIGNEIEQKMPSELVPLFHSYSDACSNLSNLTCEREYIRAYQLGAQFMLAALADKLCDQPDRPYEQ